ncbi:MAG: substrate-binding domain-containing protein [Candidatus Omnitrophota bacterium]|jgi:DNA-binding LacI/PurR family transcriptional regulator|nr:substrate-binding domain-containing protein [Candidatus Omnitrophota bacterium]
MTSLKRKATYVLVIPRFEDIFHSYYAGEIIRGVSYSASRLNADFLVHIVDRSDHRGWLDSTLMDKNYIDGIIFADIDNDIDVVKKAIRRGMPCMVLNNILDEPMNYVAVDNKKAGLQVVEYFIRLGHKDIATIAGDTTTQAGLMRLEGYREALLEHKIIAPRHYTVFGDFLRTPARAAAKKLLKLKDRPTAIFAASDVMALELMDVARSMNINIPEELSVIGFDDNPLNATSSVPLTTVSQPLMEMGRSGAENLGLISRGKARLPLKLVLPTKLVKRKSVGERKH